MRMSIFVKVYGSTSSFGLIIWWGLTFEGSTLALEENHFLFKVQVGQF
jgi:hypothetical protein